MDSAGEQYMRKKPPVCIQQNVADWNRIVKKDMSSEVILVAVDASRKITSTALEWALSNVAGDSSTVVFLAIVSSSLNSVPAGSWLWGFPSAFPILGGDCTTAGAVLVGSNQLDLELVQDRCSRLMEKVLENHESKKLRTQVETVKNADRGVVAAVAKRLKATWIILDSHLKKEAKCCLELLKVNIVTVNQQRTKILRLDLKSSDASVDLDSSSTLLDGTFIPKGFDERCIERVTKIVSFSTESSASSSPDQSFYSPSSFLKSPSAETPIHRRSLATKPQPQGFSARLDSKPEVRQQEHLRPMHKYKNEQISSISRFAAKKDCDSLDRISSVRKEMQLTRSSPARAPPLCSICQHKTPMFGKPPRKFSFQELRAATADFSSANFLAEGGFGSVYRGVLPDGQAIAVKQHKFASTQGDKEFCSEVEVLSCAQHRNLVMLIGYCVERDKRVLVYEFVCNGSLDSHLHSSSSRLDWPSRRKIAVGAARALRYLHEECRVGCIVHRDMRPRNILLTHDFEPMVGDFGLARWQPDGNQAEETKVIGALGYVAPEYAESGQITDKADVYAFGIVLLELVTGRKAIDMSRNKGEICLREWAKSLFSKMDYESMVDPHIECNDEVRTMLYVASLCVDRDPSMRPRMSQVLRILEGDPELDSPRKNPSFELDSPMRGRRPWLSVTRNSVSSPRSTSSTANSTLASPEYHRRRFKKHEEPSSPMWHLQPN